MAAKYSDPNITILLLQSPPAIVKLVMEAICVMLAMKSERKPDPATGKMVEDYWGPSVKLLSDLKFLERLKTYDKDNISPPIIKQIRNKYVALLTLTVVVVTIDAQWEGMGMYLAGTTSPMPDHKGFKLQ